MKFIESKFGQRRNYLGVGWKDRPYTHSVIQGGTRIWIHLKRKYIMIIEKKCRNVVTLSGKGELEHRQVNRRRGERKKWIKHSHNYESLHLSYLQRHNKSLFSSCPYESTTSSLENKSDSGSAAGAAHGSPESLKFPAMTLLLWRILKRKSIMNLP